MMMKLYISQSEDSFKKFVEAHTAELEKHTLKPHRDDYEFEWQEIGSLGR